MFSFSDEFQDVYKRSQTETKRKVLRCFPKCRPLGHRVNGFCGTSIRVEAANVSQDLQYWGTFAPAEGETIHTNDELDPQYFDVAPQDQTLPATTIWTPGKILRMDMDPMHIIIEFSPLNSSWDYSWWSSHKTLSQIQHCFMIVGCRQQPLGGTWVVEHVRYSPRFHVFSKSHINSRKNSTEKKVSESEFQGESKKRRRVTRKSTTTSAETTVKNNGSRDENTITTTDHDTYSVASSKISVPGTPSSWSYLGSIGNQVAGALKKLYSDVPSIPTKDTLTVEQQQNLTLDRFVSLFFDPERFRSEVNNSVVHEALASRELLVQFSDIETAFDDVFIFMRYDDTLDKIVNQYSSRAKFEEFRNMCRAELDPGFSWCSYREYETYSKNSEETSFYALVRDAYRSMFRSAMLMRGLSPEQYFDFMDFLSREGFLHHDPFHPPTVEEGRQLHWQIHGNTPYNPKAYSAGSRVFASSQVHETYAKDLLLLKRSVIQMRICDIVRERALGRQVTTNPDVGPPLDPAVDLSGVWIEDNSAGVDKKLGFYGVTGRLAGPTMTRIMRVSIGKIVMEHTSKTFIIRAQPMFSMCVIYSYINDQQFHPLSPNHPVTHFASLTGISSPHKRQYIMFFDEPTITTNVFLDFDVYFTREKILEWYPDFKMNSSEENFKYYRITYMRKKTPNIANFGFMDYFIPTSQDVYNLEFVKTLYTQGYDCPYLVEDSPLTYFRFVMESSDASEMLNLLL